MEIILWIATNIVQAFVNIAYAITHPGLWLNWSDPEAIMRFVYYGGSVEFFFAIFVSVLILTGIGMWKHSIMWGVVRGLEGFGNTVGRIAAWAGLLMVVQQIIIIFMQRIFTRVDLSFGFGAPVTFDISWWSEELKLYNAIIVCLACTYTFVQGGHVRVDLVYSAVSYRKRKIIDMIGSVLFMIPTSVVIWMYGWYFMWRHLINPPVSASQSLDRMLAGSRAFRWSVETIGFSPNGFNGYFLFKVLIVLFAGMIFLQAVAFFYRSYLELREGPESEGKYLDQDKLGDEEAEIAANIH